MDEDRYNVMKGMELIRTRDGGRFWAIGGLGQSAVVGKFCSCQCCDESSEGAIFGRCFASMEVVIDEVGLIRVGLDLNRQCPESDEM